MNTIQFLYLYIKKIVNLIILKFLLHPCYSSFGKVQFYPKFEMSFKLHVSPLPPIKVTRHHSPATTGHCIQTVPKYITVLLLINLSLSPEIFLFQFCPPTSPLIPNCLNSTLPGELCLRPLRKPGPYSLRRGTGFGFSKNRGGGTR